MLRRAAGKLASVGDGRFWSYIASSALTYVCTTAVSNVLLGLYFLEQGFGEDFIGVTISLRTLALAAAGLFMGGLTALAGRRNTALGGIALSSAGYLMQALCASPAAICAGAVVNGLGYAMVYVNESPFVSQYANAGREVEAFSLCFAVSMAATVAGSCLAGVVQGLFAANGLRRATVCFALAGFAAAAPLLRLENLRPVPAAGRRGRAALSRKGLLCIAFNFVLGCGAGAIVPFMSMFLQYKLGVSSAEIGGIMGFAEVATVAGVALVTYLARRMRKERIVVASQLLSLPFILCIAFSNSVPLTMGATFVRNALMNMCMPVMSAVYMEGLEDGERSALNGFINTANNAGRTLGTLAAGCVIGGFGYEATYFIAAACYLASAWMFAAVGRASAVERAD